MGKSFVNATLTNIKDYFLTYKEVGRYGFAKGWQVDPALQNCLKLYVRKS